jgi:hypothetical protein
MPTMRELSRWIRNYGHDARQMPRLLADRFIWHQVWTAMDVIDDVDSAMTAYLDHEFPDDIGEKYLRLYGALQGLFIQQDALLDLIRAIHPAKDICLNDVLKDIREARNASVGHPTQMKRKGVLSAHGIVQNSMCKDGFELFSYVEKDGDMFQYVPVQELIEKQRVEAARILSEVVENLREQEEVHRAQFREVKLMEVFSQVSYAFEKISDPVLGSWAVEHLRKSLDEFAKLLKARGLSIDSYDSIEYLYNQMEHPLTELTKFVRREPSEITSNKGAVVFATALQSYFNELWQIAGEIDQEYAAAPEPMVQPDHPDVGMVVATTVMGKQPGPSVPVEPIEDVSRLEPVGKRLLALVGSADKLPEDFAQNHDHYIHGAPRRSAP